jgi:ubiquinone/menaquinone biosynthesis C-methylase UbiE
MGYILESEEEFERLERQSTNPAYDYRRELADIRIAEDSRILDAGCGSGLVSRYLATEYPNARVSGCDQSPDRIEAATKAAAGRTNVSFSRASITQTPFEANSFDLVISRYVFQHLSPEGVSDAMKELTRVLKPGGQLVLIDGDGLFVNLFPQSAIVAQGLERMSESGMVDFSVGRKLPYFLAQAGLEKINWRMHSADHGPDSRAVEVELMRERFQAAAKQLENLLGEAQAAEFSAAYIKDLEAPGSTYFTQTFVVLGRKPKTALKLLKLK